ncbi:hypothetical protein N7447_009334 [Penicillium robsamsonii]|uniref:uncharacterized protein n=1 Tax=Penicillium robsamsonii TaxID=1792511 RepID=UPI002549AD11|nr:uncharacterized protein N7447_009334 [Penicillium robsamsonii]KAJ5817101.1 hypothetical protein N7447_009334 [Penicillium robsamsonii]
MGRVQIDCRFRLSKTQWGVIGGGNTPAAVLYMDLTFDQPKDCQLTSAVVSITMQESDTDPQKIHKQTASKRRSKSRPHMHDPDHGFSDASLRYLAPVAVDTIGNLTTQSKRCLQVTPYYGPHELTGKPTQITIKKNRRFTPEVNVFGQGGGGVGFDYERSSEQTSRWTFTGKVLSGNHSQHINPVINRSGPRHSRSHPKSELAMYRTMKWELNEDDNQPQSQHSSVIHTAFTFEHDMKPFYLEIQIQGKLQRKSEQLKGNMKQLLKFPSNLRKEQGTALMRVHPDSTTNHTRRLDRIAQGLSLSMERLNMENISVQLPDAMPVSFEQDTPQPFADPVPALEDQTEGRSRGNIHLFSVDTPAHSSPGKINSSSRHARTDPIPTTARNLEMLAQSLHSSQSSGSSTLCGINTANIVSQFSPPQNERRQNGETRKEKLRPQATTPSKSVIISQGMMTTETHKESDLEDIVSQLSQFPTLIWILRWAIWMFSFYPRTITEVAQERKSP